MADEAVGRLAAQVGCELRIFPRADQATEWHFTLQSFLESRVGLDLRWEVGWVLDEILGDHVHLNLT